MKKYYSQDRPQMHDFTSRKLRGTRIVKTLKHFLGSRRLKKLRVLDVGSSTGIIDSVLARNFGDVWGIDIDKKGVDFAKKSFGYKNLHFKLDSALKLEFEKDTFDVVICTHVYEHISNPKKLFSEIYRVLKPGGMCYLAAVNALWPMEPHHNLLFLSWLPKKIANFYVQTFGRAKKYYENPMFNWQLKRYVNKFRLVDYTPEILTDPTRFGYQFPAVPSFLAHYLKFLVPTFFWILVKHE